MRDTKLKIDYQNIEHLKTLSTAITKTVDKAIEDANEGYTVQDAMVNGIIKFVTVMLFIVSVNYSRHLKRCLEF